jgi:hypothetical protein
MFHFACNARAAESLSGAWGKLFGGSLLKNNFSEKNFQDNNLPSPNNFLGKNSRRVHCNCFQGTFPKFSIPNFSTSVISVRKLGAVIDSPTKVLHSKPWISPCVFQVVVIPINPKLASLSKILRYSSEIVETRTT